MLQNHSYFRRPRRKATAVFVGAMVFGAIVNACQCAPAVVEIEEPIQTVPEIQTVYFQMVEKTNDYIAPVITVNYEEPQEHDLDEVEVKLLARLLWSSPLRDERQKKALAWVVCNRIGVTPYGNSVSEVINRTEFTFLDKKAHVSEENKRIATEVLNAYYSIKDGLRIKRPFSASGVKVQFLGDPARYIRVLDKDFNVVWDGTER